MLGGNVNLRANFDAKSALSRQMRQYMFEPMSERKRSNKPEVFKLSHFFNLLSKTQKINKIIFFDKLTSNIEYPKM